MMPALPWSVCGVAAFSIFLLLSCSAINSGECCCLSYFMCHWLPQSVVNVHGVYKASSCLLLHLFPLHLSASLLSNMFSPLSLLPGSCDTALDAHVWANSYVRPAHGQTFSKSHRENNVNVTFLRPVSCFWICIFFFLKCKKQWRIWITCSAELIWKPKAKCYNHVSISLL